MNSRSREKIEEKHIYKNKVESLKTKSHVFYRFLGLIIRSHTSMDAENSKKKRINGRRREKITNLRENYLVLKF